jgi:hypothetical protein
MQIWEISASVGFIKKIFVTMHVTSHERKKCILVLVLDSGEWSTHALAPKMHFSVGTR